MLMADDAPKAFGVTDTDSSTSELATYTFSAQNLGAEHAKRKIILAIAAISGATSRTLNSVTIGGVAASVALFRANSGNSRNGHVAIAVADVPVGATGDVVVTWSGTMFDTMIGVYRALKFNSSTPHDITPDADNDNENSMSVNVPDQGCVVAARALVAATSGTWTGVTEDADQATGDGDSFSVAGQGLLAAQTGRSVVSSHGGGSPSRFCCASFG
jgi:hypothetical protein